MKKEPEWISISGSRPISGSASPSRSGAVAGPEHDRFRRHLLLRQAGRRAAEGLGHGPRVDQGHLREARIPAAERKYLAGVTAQYESEVVYHRNREDLEKLGVLFTDMDTALREYPDIVKEYFGTIIPPNDNKFAALNSAVWSGGSFIVPPGVLSTSPCRYFRINSENMGQFERTLIVSTKGPTFTTSRVARRRSTPPTRARRRGRDRGQGGRSLSLHHDPELVEQRVQPGHQAGRRRTPRWNGWTGTWDRVSP